MNQLLPIRDHKAGTGLSAHAPAQRLERSDFVFWPLTDIPRCPLHVSIAPFWLGLRGPKQTLTVIAGRDPGRSLSYWFGPDLPGGESFDTHVLIYPDMGSGDLLYRHHNTSRICCCPRADAVA